MLDYIKKSHQREPFTKKEIEIAEKSGFKPASVGERILRAETAAIILVGIVQYEWGDLGL